MPGTSKRQAGQRDRRDREAKLPPTPAPEAVAVSTARFWAERQERADQDYRVRQLLTRREPDLDASQRVRRSCLIVTLPSDMVTVARFGADTLRALGCTCKALARTIDKSETSTATRPLTQLVVYSGPSQAGSSSEPQPPGACATMHAWDDM